MSQKQEQETKPQAASETKPAESPVEAATVQDTTDTEETDDQKQVAEGGGTQVTQQPEKQASKKKGKSSKGMPRLRLDLNIEVELELKLKVHGDVTLALLT